MAGRVRNWGQAPIVRSESTPAQACGRQAEQLAEQYLRERGLRPIARNVRCRGGEIDLVCLDDDTLVFVEVRLRRNHRFGGAAASITPRKQQRVIVAAQWWLSAAGRRHATRACRFDAILLDALDAKSIEWIPSAFTLDTW